MSHKQTIIVLGVLRGNGALFFFMKHSLMSAIPICKLLAIIEL